MRKKENVAICMHLLYILDICFFFYYLLHSSFSSYTDNTHTSIYAHHILYDLFSMTTITLRTKKPVWYNKNYIRYSVLEEPRPYQNRYGK